MRDFSVRQNSRRAVIWRDDKENNRLAIFIHGFNGSFLETWGEFPHLLHTQADSDQTLALWDYMFIGYRTLGPGGVADFGQIARLIFTQVVDASLGNLAERQGVSYSSIALVGHSLGTLGIREFVASPAHCPTPQFGLIARLGLMGTPLDGSLLAFLAQWVAPIASALRPQSTELSTLKTLVSSGWKARPWSQPLLQLGMHDLVVGAPYLSWPGDQAPPRLVAAGHSAICKPIDFNDDPVVFLRSLLR